MQFAELVGNEFNQNLEGVTFAMVPPRAGDYKSVPVVGLLHRASPYIYLKS